ncbi:hypothetical protein HOLleu_00212 [Holothuria leucospilota]|uniref:Uncharacterized protein n=1 Tax=Holothuria leucospilota TaxID=206669 RepID=A0A9Q1CLY5_HOLLE|nr:hypothetical protein HOLleu_00212 [Holothuria leucospilota]
MRYSEKMNPIIFGGGQRSSGVTRGKCLKTLSRGYLQMCYSENMYPIVFGGVGRSSRVTRGQTLKTLLTQFLKGESLDRFYASMWMCYGEKMDCIVLVEVKGHLGSPEIKMQISQEFPRLNRNTKLYFSNMLR